MKNTKAKYLALAFFLKILFLLLHIYLKCFLSIQVTKIVKENVKSSYQIFAETKKNIIIW